MNFELEVSAVTTEIEVSTSAADILLESSSSVGDVLNSETVMDLPQVGRDVLDLIKVMSGVVVSDGEVYGRNDTSFAGVQATGVNIQRDGITVNDVRFPTGINAATRVNPDMVGEFKMVLAPVDAESGRGNAQVHIATKSGSNQYHGNAVWNAQNTSLDPNTWDNNRTGTVPPWRNMQEFSASVSGPIIKNKTFFFVLFDYQLAKVRQAYNAQSITPCARRGIFRYWDRWNNQNAEYTNAETSSTSSNPYIATVDYAGNPVKPAWEPGSTDGTPNWGNVPYTGELRYVSIFGTLLNADTINADCSNAVFDTDSWDPRRTEMDPS
ncbi:MAG: Plug domain-containing protein, partial [Acidobacteriota bacterium]